MIGTRLADLRSAAGLSQRELGRLAGLLSESHVEAIESGRSSNPEARTLHALARVLGTTIDWLFAEIGERPPGEAVVAAVESARAAAAQVREAS